MPPSHPCAAHLFRIASSAAGCCLLPPTGDWCWTSQHDWNTPWLAGGAPGVAGCGGTAVPHSLSTSFVHPGWVGRNAWDSGVLPVAKPPASRADGACLGLNVGLCPEPGFMLSLQCRNDGPQVSGLSSVSDPVVGLELWMLIPSWFWDSCDVLLTS